jgi:hypothetical protein
MSWADDWKKVKTRFEQETGKKKPSNKFLGIFRLGTGIENALKQCDEMDGKLGAAIAKRQFAEAPKLLENFDLAITAFDTAQSGYQKQLAGAMEKSDEVLKPFLDVLSKELKALLSKITVAYKARALVIEQAGKDLSALDYAFKMLTTSLESGIKKAEAFAAVVRSKPLVETFNTGIVQAARDITQQIGNVQKAKTAGYQFEGDPTNLFKVMTPWAQGQRKVPGNATKEMVIRELGAFTQCVTGVKTWLAHQH